MKTIGERIKQARDARKWSAMDLAVRCGYKTQSGISNLENRVGGSGGNKIHVIAEALNVPIKWLMSGPDSDKVPFLSTEQNADPADHHQVNQENLNDRLVKFPPVQDDQDPWIAAAVQILRELDPGQRQAMVAKMREFRQYLGPPRDGQALSVAG